MNLKNIVTTGMIIGTGLVSCKKSDMPITPELQAKLDSIKAHDSMILAQQELQHQKDIIATLQPIPEERIIQQDSLIQDSVIRHSLSDTLMTTPSDDRIQPSDSISGTNSLDHTSSSKTQDILQPTKASGPQVTEGVEKSMEKKNTITILDNEWKDVLNIIIKPSQSIQFDDAFVKEKVLKIFLKHFVRKDNAVLFQAPSLQDQKAIYSNMEDIRHHIKQYNGFAVKLLLGKGKMKSYILDQLAITYKELILNNKLAYKGGENQFKKDVELIIDIYQ